MIKTIVAERRHILLAVIALSLIGYIYLTPPMSQSSIAAWLGIETGYTPEFEMYIQRFVIAFFLLGLFPVIAARVCGYRLGDLGIRKPECKRLGLCLAAALAAGAVIGIVGSFSAPLSGFYPYDAGLAERVESNGIWPFILHAVCYGLLYYLPWEVLFRGVFIFPFIEEKIGNISPNGRTFLLASIQVIPSSLLHFGHPVTETLGAVVFGFFAGWITVKTRSIVPALFIHAATGIFLDLAVVLGSG